MPNDLQPLDLKSAQELKQKTGRKAIGYFCLQTPLEFIEAAGMIPVRILGDTGDITEADGLLPPFICSFIRNCLDVGLKGGYDFLDGLVVPHTCDTVKSLYGIWKNNLPLEFVHFLSYPIVLDKPQGRELVIALLQELRQSLGALRGQPISDAELAQAIAVYNQSRALYGELAGKRRQDPPGISTSELLALARRAFYQPRADFVADLKAAAAVAGKGGRPRVVLTGSPMPDLEIIKVVEEAGLSIVGDDICTGSRFFAGRVAEEGDPLAALADHYLASTTCACKLPASRRLGDLKALVEGSGRVDGVLMLAQKFCDPQLWDYPAIKEFCAERNLPLQLIEVEYRLGSSSGLRNRVQAFIEMVKE